MNLRTNSTLVRRISSPLHYRSANSPEHLLLYCKVKQSKRARKEICGKTGTGLDDRYEVRFVSHELIR